MDVSSPNTESRLERENVRKSTGEKNQRPNESTRSSSSKNRRRKKAHRSTRSEDDFHASLENAGTSDGNLSNQPVKEPDVERNVNTCEGNVPEVGKESVGGGDKSSAAGKSIRKGRYAKKKAVAASLESSPQVPQAGASPGNNDSFLLRNKPKPQRYGTPGIPAGLQPKNYIRPSPATAVQESPKQEKYLPYWPEDAVQIGLASGSLINGIIRINPRNFQKAYISYADEVESNDVLIDGVMDRNRALEGDEVAVHLYEPSKWQIEEDADGGPEIRKTGMVVFILSKNHNRRTVGYLKLVNKTPKSAQKKTPKKEGKRNYVDNDSPTSSKVQHSSNSPLVKPVNLSEAKISYQSSVQSPNANDAIESHEEEPSESSGVQTEKELNVIVQDAGPSRMMQTPVVSEVGDQTPQPKGNSAHGSPSTGSQKQRSRNRPSYNQRTPTQQQKQSVVSSDGPPETPKSSKEGEVEPFRMPDKVLFSPRDPRMPRMWVKTSTLPSGTPEDLNPSNCQNHLFLANIHEWNQLPVAIGNLIAYIGEADEVDTETAALLLEHDLDVTPYPESLFNFPSQPYQIPEKELSERLDLRKMCIFTIDPATAKDLDDALSVREMENGMLEVGVHIADPSFFLEEDSPLDLCVRKRATSIYLVQNVFHMLPKELCMLCSLLPGEDKLGFSVIMEVDPKTWKVVSHKFSRSIVNSCAQLSYEHAQAFIDDPNRDWSKDDFPVVHNGYTLNDLCRAVNLLWPFSSTMRERRFAIDGYEIVEDENFIPGGSLKINQPKLCFKLDPATCMPQEVFLYENRESHRLIEELMLLANILTAKKLKETFPKHAFLRRHSKPKMKLLNNLAQKLTYYGIHLDTSAAGNLNASLKQYGIESQEDSKGDGCCSPYCKSPSRSPAQSDKQTLSDNSSCSDKLISNSPQESRDENCQNSTRDQETIVEDKNRIDSVQSEDDPLLTVEGSEGLNKNTVDSEMIVVEEEIDETFVVKEQEDAGVNSSPLPAVEGIEQGLKEMTVDSEMIVIEEDTNKTYVVKEREDVGVTSFTLMSSTRNNESTLAKYRGGGEFVDNRMSMLNYDFFSHLKNSPCEHELAFARELVLNHLCAKPMVRADYYCLGASVEPTATKNLKWKLDDISSCEEDGEVYTHHYALNFPLYTHFTSPIRRYADIMVHRLLAASLGYSPPPDVNPLDIQKIATNCNKQNMGAKKASEASNELFFRLWVRLQVEKDNHKDKRMKSPNDKSGNQEDNRSEGSLRETAVVVYPKDYSFDAILLRFGVIVRVYLNNIPADVHSYKENGTSTIAVRWHLPGKKTATVKSPVQRISMFSLVDLMVYYSYTSRRVRAEIISPFSPLNNYPKS